jgi:hypothetical protein
MTLDRTRLAALADYVAAAVAVSLPWSTSATSILVTLWVMAVALTFDGGSLRQVGAMPVAVFPIALVVLALGGMLWADVAWPERLSGAVPFLKLLVIPLLLLHFRRTDRGELVFTAFFTSACVLLALSWLLALFPGFPWPARDHGVPVKDYIIQSGIFTLCFFALLDRAVVMWASHAQNPCFSLAWHSSSSATSFLLPWGELLSSSSPFCSCCWASDISNVARSRPLLRPGSRLRSWLGRRHPICDFE